MVFFFLVPTFLLWKKQNFFSLSWDITFPGIETYDWLGGPLDKNGFPLLLLVDSAENCAEQTDWTSRIRTEVSFLRTRILGHMGLCGRLPTQSHEIYVFIYGLAPLFAYSNDGGPQSFTFFYIVSFNHVRTGLINCLIWLMWSVWPSLNQVGSWYYDLQITRSFKHIRSWNSKLICFINPPYWNRLISSLNSMTSLMSLFWWIELKNRHEYQNQERNCTS